MVFKLILAFGVEIALKWMSWALSDHMSTSVLLMVWCHEGTSYYLNQCSQMIMSSYDVTGSQWYKIERPYLLWTSFREKAWAILITLHWRNNGRDGVSNDQPPHCLLNRLFRCRSKKTSKLCHWPVNSPHKWLVTRKMFPFDDVIMSWSIHPFINIVQW